MTDLELAELLEEARKEAKRREREQFWDTVMWLLLPVPLVLTVILEFIRRF